MRALVAGLPLLIAAVPAGAEQAKTYHIPYRLTDTQHVLVRVKLNGQGPFNFIIDTGAPALILSEEVGKKLGLKPDGGDEPWTTFKEFQVEGGLTIPKAKGLVLDMFQLKGMNGMGLAGVKLHGVIGYNLLAKYRIAYDFTKDKLTWTELDYAPPPIRRIGKKAKGNSQGGMEMIGSLMGGLGKLLGRGKPPVPQPRGYLGVEFAGPDEDAVITKVYPGSPADRAELKKGDRVTRAEFRGGRAGGGGKVSDAASLIAALKPAEPGTEVTLTLKRGGDTKTVTVKLGEGL